MKKTLLFNLLISSCLYGNDMPWKDRHAEGWAWYHDRKAPKEKEIVIPEAKTPVQTLAVVKEELEMYSTGHA